MIFGKEYDNSLYYMLKHNNLDKLRIIKFVNDLPDELINNIQIEVSDYLKDIALVGKKDKTFYNVYSDKKQNIKYKFFINGGLLNIFKYKVRNDKEKQIEGIMLETLRSEYFDNLSEKKYGVQLGSYCTGGFPSLNFLERDYDIVATKLGSMFCIHHCVLMNFVELKFYFPVRIKGEETELFRKSEIQRQRK